MASLLSTVVLSAGGYAALGWASCAMALLVALVQARSRVQRPSTSEEPAVPSMDPRPG